MQTHNASGKVTKSVAFNLDIQATVGAVDRDHALMMVALDLMRRAFADEGKRKSDVFPAGYVARIDVRAREAREVDLDAHLVLEAVRKKRAAGDVSEEVEAMAKELEAIRRSEWMDEPVLEDR